MSKTLIASSKPPSDRQVEMFFDKLRFRIGKRIKGLGVTSQQLQAISSEGLDEMAGGFLSLVHSVARMIGTIVDLTVDYGKAPSELIKEAGLVSVDVEVELIPEEIPGMGKGRKTIRVRQVHRNRVITIRELVRGLPKMIDPIAALHYAIKHRGEQDKYPLAIAWEASGHYFFLILQGNAVRLENVFPNDSFGQNFRFLTSCK